MAWIESHQTLLRHPKTLALCEELSTDKFKVIGHLHALWWWALDIADSEGKLPKSTTDLAVADGSGWPVSEAAAFVAALRSAGFLEKRGYVLHDWYGYAGKLNATRAANRERMKEKRATHVQRTKPARAGATEQDRTGHDQQNRTGPTEQDQDEEAAPLSRRRIFVLYDNFMGTPSVTAAIAEQLKLAEEEFPGECIEHCFEEAARSSDGRRSWKYVHAILQRHAKEGCTPLRRPSVVGVPSQESVAEGWLAYERSLQR